jgi:transposase
MTWSNSLLVVPLINSSRLQWRRSQPCDNDSCRPRALESVTSSHLSPWRGQRRDCECDSTRLSDSDKEIRMIKCNRDQVKRLLKALRREKDPVLRQRIQMVLLREDGNVQRKIAELMGVSLSTVNRAHVAYDSGGVSALRRKPTGGRRHENMTLEEEKALLARFTKAVDAGVPLNIAELKLAYEKEIGRPTSNSTVYGLLARHELRKLVPQPLNRNEISGHRR